MKVFFLGGTFNPPHFGHTKIVEECLDRCDKFILIPNEKSPEKLNFIVTKSSHRLNMLRLIFDSSKVNIDEFELKSNNINYTYLTIRYLRKKYKDASLTMVLGLDQLLNFKNWKNNEEIIDSVNILCFNRYSKLEFNRKNMNFNNIKFIDNFNIEISSSSIREKIKNFHLNQCIKTLDKKVLEYIKKHQLYAT